MWSIESVVEANATPEAVWTVWTAVEAWPQWDVELSSVTLSGPFAVGTQGSLTPAGAPPVAFTLTYVEPQVGFDDESPLPGAVLRFSHRVRKVAPGRVEVIHRAEIDGEQADMFASMIGPKLTAGHKIALQALARRAEACAVPR